jgi:oxygen-independent coproporphyrinogen-3 oxidase
VRTGEVVLPSDHIALQQFADLREWAKIHNYEHYELSNFSQPGRHSIHNKHYWSYQPYLGIGPGAHSFNGEQRSWNVSNNIRYAKGEAGDHENLSVQEKLNERLMVRLHTSDGFILSRDLDPLGLNPDMTARFTYNIKNALEQGKIIEIPGGFRISASDWIVSDRIISDLFIED